MEHSLTIQQQARLATLTINRIANGQREFVEQHDVIGKREAKAIAKALGATPWNF